MDMTNSYSLPGQMRRDNTVGSARRHRREQGKTNRTDRDLEVETQYKIVPKVSARRRKGRPRGMEGHMTQNELIDVTGDGNITSWEVQASQELQNVEGRDLYGDGKVSEDEVRLTRVIEGRKLWCKRFIQKNIDTIPEFHPLFKGQTPKQILDIMLDDPDDFGGFSVMCAEMENKERLLMRNSSIKMQRCLSFPEEPPPGPETARILQEVRLARVYKEPRSDVALRPRGSIPEYRNFSNFAKYLSIHEGKSV